MKTKSIFAATICLTFTLFSSMGQNLITALSSGNWSDTNIWDSGTVPGTSTNDAVDIPEGINVTVDTNEVIQFVTDSGTLTMGQNASLNVTGNSTTIDSSINLVISAPGNTIIYSGNPYNALSHDYWNLVLANTNWVGPANAFVAPWQDFNNFFSGGASGPTPMTIYGNMTLMGAIKVQEANVAGVPITIDGNLTIGAGCAWDCSSGSLTVSGNLYLNGFLEDLDGANGSNFIGGSVIISGPSTPNRDFASYTNGLYLGDVTTWGIGGNLTNNGAIFGIGYASLFLNGTGSIAGSNTITIPTITIDGTYAIANTVMLTTNNANLYGTVVFDLANTNQIALKSSPAGPNNQTNYYGGNLVVIDTGAAPASGKSYKLFNGAHYTGAFAPETLPGLSPGLSWVDNLTTSGSIAVAGSGGGSPVLILTQSGNLLSLSWDSTNFPGFSVKALTNSSGLSSALVWISAGSTTNSPFNVTINPTNPPVFFRLSNP